DMGELHAQIAVATRRLELGVEEMKAKTASQLSEIGRTSETIARLKAELGERTVALQALTIKERAQHEQLRTTEAELMVRTVAHALEGLGSPIETMLAGKASELEGLSGALNGGQANNPSVNNGGDDTKGSLARRIRSLQKRAARVSSAGGS